MSMEMVAHVRQYSKSTRSARLLLLVIASHVSPTTGLAWPSIATLVEETGYTERHVCRLLKSLERGGELRIEHGGGRGRSNRYRVMVPGEFSTAPVTRRKTLTSMRSKL